MNATEKNNKEHQKNINDLTIPFLTLWISRCIMYSPSSSIRGDRLYKAIQKDIKFLQEKKAVDPCACPHGQSCTAH
jgi:hypothetical protein